jgi:hypothetical protein
MEEFPHENVRKTDVRRADGRERTNHCHRGIREDLEMERGRAPRWREHEGKGYWKGGDWRIFKPPLIAI